MKIKYDEFLQLLIHIAEFTALPSKSIKQLPERNRRCVNTEVIKVIQGPIVTGRVIVNGERSRDGILPRCQVLNLPDPPDTVDHAVVEEEGRVARGGKEVLRLR